MHGLDVSVNDRPESSPQAGNTAAWAGPCPQPCAGVDQLPGDAERENARALYRRLLA